MALLALAGHPLEKVSEAALHGALSVWDIDATFAWIALGLAIRISTGSRDDPIATHGYDHPRPVSVWPLAWSMHTVRSCLAR
jgi:hypothetical protein